MGNHYLNAADKPIGLESMLYVQILINSILLGGIYAIVRYFGSQTFGRLMIAGCLAAIGIFVKGPCLFPVLGVFLSLSIWRQRLKGTLRDLRTYIFICLRPILAHDPLCRVRSLLSFPCCRVPTVP